MVITGDPNLVAKLPPVRGYSLGEVVIALALMAILLVFVSGLFLKLFQSSTKGLDASIALQMAESTMIQAKDADPASWPGLSGSRQVINRDTQVTSEFVTEVVASNPPISSNEMGEVYELTVAVYWMDQSKDPASRRGYGRQSVRLSRLVYVSNMK